MILAILLLKYLPNFCASQLNQNKEREIFLNYGNVIIEIGGRGERKKNLNCDNLIAEREREREKFNYGNFIAKIEDRGRKKS